MAGIAELSDEEILRNLPDDVILQQIGGQQQPGSIPPSIRDIAMNAAMSASPMGAPFALAQSVSRLPQEAVVPTLATGGGLMGARGGMIPSALGAGLGAGVGELELARRQAESGVPVVPAEILQRAGMSAAKYAAGDMAIGAAMGTGRFLKGNIKGIEMAEKALEKAAHGVIQNFRQGGALHKPIMDALHTSSEEAWAPMKQLANAIEGEIPLSEVKAIATSKFSNEPARAQALSSYLDDIAEGQASFSAPALVDLRTGIGQSMRKAALTGKMARSVADTFKADARSVIAEVLTARAPLEMKGAVAQASQQWASHAADRDMLFRFFAPSAAKEVETKTGVSLLKRLMEGNMTQSESEFLQRMAARSGIDVSRMLEKPARSLAKARAWGAAGSGTGAFLKGAGADIVKGAGIGTVGYLVGRSLKE